MHARVTLVMVFLGLTVLVVSQLCYFSFTRGLSHEQRLRKEQLIAFVGLPDVALVSEAHFIRHRSLSDVFSSFNESPELLEYFPSTFVYQHPRQFHPSRIEHHAF